MEILNSYDPGNGTIAEYLLRISWMVICPFHNGITRKWRKVEMSYSFVFFLNSALLGVGLAMDAFSVSLANGLHERPHHCRVFQGF